MQARSRELPALGHLHPSLRILELGDGGLEQLVTAVRGDPEAPGDHVDRLLVAQAAEDHLELALLQAGEELRDQLPRFDALLATWIVIVGVAAEDLLRPGSE